MTTYFNGFPKDCMHFLEDLEQNNDREWFNTHKTMYEKNVLAPARLYVAAMGERLQRVIPGIQAIPMVDKSIFRIHRDTRFSTDKQPFKTHVGIFLWEGEGKKLDASGFYLHIEKDKLLIGGGIHIFSPPLLVRYRECVDNAKRGGRLKTILDKGQQHFGADLDTDTYKRVPRGYPADHPRADLLKKKGVTLGETTAIPPELHTPDALDYIYARFEKIVPLHRWLVEMTRLVDDPMA